MCTVTSEFVYFKHKLRVWGISLYVGLSSVYLCDSNSGSVVLLVNKI